MTPAEFLAAVMGGTHSLCVAERDGSGFRAVGFYDDADELLELAAEHTAAGRHVWIGAHPLRARPTSGRGTAGDVASVRWLVADLDWADEVHAAGGLRPEAEVRALVASCEYPPTITVDTGHGLHAWWRLAAPVEPEVGHELILRLHAYLAGLGLKPERDDLASVLRLPGSVNMKAEPVPVVVCDVAERTYQPEYLARRLPQATSAPRKASGGSGGAWGPVDRSTLHPATVAALRAAEALGGHGAYVADGVVYVTRPGKTAGTSMSIGKLGPGVAWCFTSAWRAPNGAVLERDRRYDADELAALAAGRRVQPGEDVDAPPVPAVLPDEFWSARPVLDHVRQAARARLLAPDGVFGAVLARVCVLTPFQLALAPTVARYGSLNIFVALPGAAGSGKGSSIDLADELLANVMAPHRLGEGPAGSGEGIVKAFYDRVTVEEPQPSGKTRSVTKWEQTKDAYLVRVDEGSTLRGLTSRSGSTTFETLRAAWSGERLGGAYADPERRGFVLAPHTYRMAVVMGVQPTLAEFLFADADGGTPQRFMWLSLVDPGAPALDDVPDWPGPLDWHPPRWDRAEQVKLGGYRRGIVTVAQAITDELRARRRDVVAGLRVADPLDAHGDLVRLKVAALLAILDGRTDVNADDWRLAGIVDATSRAVRAGVRAELRAQADSVEGEQLERAARRAGAAEAGRKAVVVEVERLARRLAGYVVEAGTEGATRGALNKRLRSAERAGLDAALGHALKASWIIWSREADRYEPGPTPVGGQERAA